MLAVAKFTEGNLFSGCIIGWLIGVPLLLVILFNQDDFKEEILLINPQRCENPEQIIQLNNFLLELRKGQSSDSHLTLMLEAYMEIHKQTCSREDCPLKNLKINKNLMNRISKSLNLDTYG